jgi:hypothetical protein
VWLSAEMRVMGQLPKMQNTRKNEGESAAVVALEALEQRDHDDNVHLYTVPDPLLSAGAAPQQPQRTGDSPPINK